MQDPNPDSNDATSEGIFVFTSSAPAVSVGDAVRVGGTVQEFRSGGASGQPISRPPRSAPRDARSRVLSSGNPLPPPVIIGTGGRIPPATVIEDDATGDVETSGVFDPASDGIDFYESLEGMLVQVNNAVATGPWHNFGSNREIPVVGDNGANAGRCAPRAAVSSSRPTDFNPERIILNDLIAGGPNAAAGQRGRLVPRRDRRRDRLQLRQLQAGGHLAARPGFGGLTQEVTHGCRQRSSRRGHLQRRESGTHGPAGEVRYPGGADRQPPAIAGHHWPSKRSRTTTAYTDNGTVDASTTWSKLIAAIQAAGGPTLSIIARSIR